MCRCRTHKGNARDPCEREGCLPTYRLIGLNTSVLGAPRLSQPIERIRNVLALAQFAVCARICGPACPSSRI